MISATDQSDIDTPEGHSEVEDVEYSLFSLKVTFLEVLGGTRADSTSAAALLFAMLTFSLPTAASSGCSGCVHAAAAAAPDPVIRVFVIVKMRSVGDELNVRVAGGSGAESRVAMFRRSFWRQWKKQTSCDHERQRR